MTIPADALVSTYEETGYFWLPGAPDERLPGRLIFNPPDAFKIELQGLFGTLQEALMSMNDTSPVRYPLVNGVLASGEALSLVNVMRGNCNVRFGKYGAAKSDLYPLYAVVGIEVSEPEALTFQRYSVWLGHLEDWVHESGVTSSVEYGEYQNRIDRVDFSFSRPAPIAYELNGLRLSVELQPLSSFDLVSEFHFVERARLTLELNLPVSILDFGRHYLGQLRDFIALAVCQPIQILHLVAWPSEPSSTEDSRGEKPTLRPSLTVLYSLKQITGTKRNRVHPLEMLLPPLPEIKEELGRVLTKWFSIHGDMEDILKSFWGLFHTDELAPNFRFLNLVSILEAFHVRTTRRNDLTLRVRLDDLFARAQHVLAVPNLDAHITHRVVATRNYYSHYDSHRRKNSFSDGELFAANELLKWIFLVLLLLHLDFPVEFCKQRFKDNQPYLQFLRYQWPSIDGAEY